jgi:hypothetical protein
MLTAQPLANPSAVVLCDATLRLTVRTLGSHLYRLTATTHIRW